MVAEPEEEFDWESTGKNNKSTTLPSSNATDMYDKTLTAFVEHEIEVVPSLVKPTAMCL
nr:hypothetical protein [Bacteroidota bacterium]